MEVVHMLQSRRGMRHMLSTKPGPLRYAVYVLVVLAVFLLGKFENQQFIYFQF